jgi:alpha-2-macroglobulin
VTQVDGRSGFALTAAPRSVSDTTMPIASFARRVGDSLIVSVSLGTSAGLAYYSATVVERTSQRAVTQDRRGLVVERWIERFSDGQAVDDVAEGELVRVRLRIRAEFAREFVALEDWLPAGLEVVDPSLRISSTGAALIDRRSADAARQSDEEAADEAEGAASRWYGPWEYRELRDDKVRWFARQLTPGSHTVSYLARATSAGRFVRAPAHAEEMYNPGVNGRSEGGWFSVRSR